MEKKKKIILTQEVLSSSPVRLRTYAQKYFKSFYPSNKSIKKALDQGLFQLNGNSASTATYVKNGDRIDLLQDESKKEVIYPLKLPVLYEDEHCAVINKPSGIPVHSHGKRNIVNALNFNLKASGHPTKLSQAHPIHRLDALTNGLLIIAKTRLFQVEAGQLLESKNIKKYYTAILIGKLKGKGIMDQDISNKKALTKYESLSIRNDLTFPLSLVKLQAITGRTHQLRIHCAELGYPILGEKLYYKEQPNIKGKGLFLCSTTIQFTHPLSKESISVTTQPPKKYFKYFANQEINS